MHRNLREFLALVKRMGLTVDHLENGRHIKVNLRDAEGRTCLYVLSRSSSDWRALRNAECDIRESLR